MSILTKQYIKRRAKEEGKTITKDDMKILKYIKKREKANGICIIFSWIFDHNSFINAHASGGKIILMNPEWAVRLILFYDDRLENALNITIGHELTHKDNQFFPCRLGWKKTQFVSWVNEVRADFGGAQKRANSSRQRLLDSISYKKELHPSKDLFTHPSWDRREIYAKEYNFDSKLINKIADDLGYTNQHFRDRVCSFYEKREIILD